MTVSPVKVKIFKIKKCLKTHFKTIIVQIIIMYLKVHNKKDFIDVIKVIKYKDGLNKNANFMNILLKIIKK